MLMKVIVFAKTHIWALLTGVLLCVFFITTGLQWCIIPAVILIVGFRLLQGLSKRKSSPILTSALFIFFVFFISLLCRLFVVGIYLVPSESMADQIYPGDYLVVNRLCYGPKLPESPYTLPDMELLFTGKKLSNSDSVCWGYHRLILCYKKE